MSGTCIHCLHIATYDWEGHSFLFISSISKI